MGNNGRNRACPRCGGILYIEKDIHGWYEECLQCAYMRDLEAYYKAKKPVVLKKGNYQWRTLLIKIIKGGGVLM